MVLLTATVRLKVFSAHANARLWNLPATITCSGFIVSPRDIANELRQISLNVALCISPHRTGTPVSRKDFSAEREVRGTRQKLFMISRYAARGPVMPPCGAC